MEKIKSTIKTTPLSDAYYNCNFMSVILLRRNPKEHKKIYWQNHIHSAIQPRKQKKTTSTI